MEVVNKCSKAYLHCAASNRQAQWVHWLPLAKWWYNTSYHIATKMMPFEVVCGQMPLLAILYLLGPRWKKPRDSMSTFFLPSRIIWCWFKSTRSSGLINIAPNTTLTKAIRCFWFSDPINRHHSEKSHQKLAPNFYGPYTTLKCIGLVTYKFALPSHSKMYVVFHVSCLKKVIESSCRVQTRLLELDVEGSIWLQPEAILDKHECHFRWCTIEEVLIQWKYTDLEDATWESTDIFHQFPHLQP